MPGIVFHAFGCRFQKLSVQARKHRSSLVEQSDNMPIRVCIHVRYSA